MAPADPTIGRIVVYRSLTGLDLPAIIAATVATLDPAGVKLYRETRAPEMTGGAVDLLAKGVPPLSSADHVHLVVFSPGLPGNAPMGGGRDANMGGTYREWNVPLFEPHGISDPRPGATIQQAEPEPRSWRWPERA